MILSAGKSESFKNATSIGIGLIESAINLTQIILKEKPKSLLFIGSAGSYGGYKIFDIVKSNISSNIELSFLQKQSYTPIDNVVQSMSDEKMDISNIVNSSNYISTDENISKKFLNLKVEIENMEFYSVLKVAEKFKIPAMGIFVVTNYCNQNAHQDFLKNHQKAIKILLDYVAEYKER